MPFGTCLVCTCMRPSLVQAQDVPRPRSSALLVPFRPRSSANSASGKWDLQRLATQLQNDAPYGPTAPDGLQAGEVFLEAEDICRSLRRNPVGRRVSRCVKHLWMIYCCWAEEHLALAYMHMQFCRASSPPREHLSPASTFAVPSGFHCAGLRGYTPQL